MDSREKGKRGERELAGVLRSYGYDTRRGVQYKGGPESPDVAGLPGVHIECKRVERLNVYDSLDQSVRDAGEDEIPVVMSRRNHSRWIAHVYLDDFMEMYRIWELYREEER